jgi:hypothetical protein
MLIFCIIKIPYSINEPRYKSHKNVGMLNATIWSLQSTCSMMENSCKVSFDLLNLQILIISMIIMNMLFYFILMVLKNHMFNIFHLNFF